MQNNTKQKIDFFKRGLSKNELNSLLQDGVISQDQAHEIAIRFEKSSSLSIYLKIFAYIFLSLSLLLIVSANWEEMQREFRVVILLGFLILSGFGAFLSYDKNKFQAELLAILSNFVFAANIFLISQMFNLGDDINLGLMTISCFALISSFVFASNLVFIQAYIFAIIWQIIMTLAHEPNLPFYLIFVIFGIYKEFKHNSTMLSFTNYFGINFIFWILSERFELYYGHIFPLIISFSLLVLSDKFVFKKGAKAPAFLCVYISFFASILSFGYNNLFIFSDYSNFILFFAFMLGLVSKNFISLMAVLAIFLTQILQIYLRDSYYLQWIVVTIFSLCILQISVAFIKFESFGYKLFGTLSLSLLGFVLYIRLVGDYLGASFIFVVFALILLILSKKTSR